MNKSKYVYSCVCRFIRSEVITIAKRIVQIPFIPFCYSNLLKAHTHAGSYEQSSTIACTYNLYVVRRFHQDQSMDTGSFVANLVLSESRMVTTPMLLDLKVALITKLFF